MVARDLLDLGLDNVRREGNHKASLSLLDKPPGEGDQFLQVLVLRGEARARPHHPYLCVE